MDLSFEPRQRPLFVGLGSNCYVSWMLRKLDLQQGTLPLDWAVSFDFATVPPLLGNCSPLPLQDLCKSELLIDAGQPKSLYSAEYNIRLPHEFEVDPEVTLDDIRRRYARRIDRFWTRVAGAERTIFVRTLNHEIHSERENIAAVVEETRHFHERHKGRMNEVHYLVLSHDAHPNFEHPNDGAPITVIDSLVPLEQAFYECGTYDLTLPQAEALYRDFFDSFSDPSDDIEAAYWDIVERYSGSRQRRPQYTNLATGTAL